MGFFGMGNDAKNVTGVSKDAPEKKPFFKLIDMIAIRFWKLISLSLIYLLFCVPAIIVGAVGYYLSAVLIPPTNDALYELMVSIVIAIAYSLTGPANVAITKISRYYVEEKMVMLFSDFFDALKSNFTQGLQRGVFNAISLLLFYHATIFYVEQINNDGGTIYLVSLIMVILVGIVMLFTSYYSGLLVASIYLPFFYTMKNALMFSFICVKSNIIITLYNIIIMIPILLYFPLTILTLLILPAINSLVIVFNIYPYVYKYSIKPFYDENNLENPNEVEKENISIFED